MTPSQQAKQYGCRSVKAVSDSCLVPVRTLYDWHRTKPELYRCVCLGHLALQASIESAILRNNSSKGMLRDGLGRPAKQERPCTAQ